MWLAAVDSMAETTAEAYYRGDVLHNSGGGIDTGSVYLDDAGLTIGTELGGLFGASDAEMFAYFLYNNGTSFSETLVGDLQTVSNIDAPEAFRVYEFWYQQSWSNDASLRAGLYDLNSEFDAIDTAGLFTNSSHGIGAEFAQSGFAGPSIFPVTSLGIRFEWSVSDTGKLRYAVLDGVPGDPDDASKTAIRLGGDDGVLHAIEYNYAPLSGARFGIGGWLYSAEFDVISEPGAPGSSGRDNGNGGVYGFVDFPLLPASSSGLDLSAFLRFGTASEKFNVLESYLGGGVVLSGFSSERPEDRIGLAFARAQVSDRFRRGVASAGGSRESSETSIEFTYSREQTDWLRIQPDIQYILNPGADPALANTWVVGLQFELSARRHWD